MPAKVQNEGMMEGKQQDCHVKVRKSVLRIGLQPSALRNSFGECWLVACAAQSTLRNGMREIRAVW